MKAKNLLILCVVALVLGGLAYLSSTKKNRTSQASQYMGKQVLPTLQDDAKVASIERIIVQNATSTITVLKTDEGWVVPEKYNYPTEFSRVRDLISTLIELKVGHVVPKGESELKKLSLFPPIAGQTNEASGILIKLQNKSGSDIASLVVGKEHMKSASPDPSLSQFGAYTDGRFVAADGKGYLVDNSLFEIPDKPLDLFETKLVSIYGSAVKEMSITDNKGANLSLKRPKAGAALQIDNLNADEEMDAEKVNALSGILSYMSFIDVADPSLSEKDSGLDKPIVVIAKTDDGRTYRMNIGISPSGSKNSYMKLSALYEPLPAQEEAKEEDHEGHEHAMPKKNDPVKLAAEIDAFNKQCEKWTYIVEAHKLSNLTTKREDVVKKKKAEAKKDSQ